jgi:hypothetical protein
MAPIFDAREVDRDAKRIFGLTNTAFQESAHKTGERVTVDTIFQIGSLTKTFSAFIQFRVWAYAKKVAKSRLGYFFSAFFQFWTIMRGSDVGSP